jgi:cold shock CspA family protein
MEQERERGTIVLLKPNGYGFIQPIDGFSQDIYFHVSDLPVPGLPGSSAIELGTRVTYVVGDRNGRPIARQIIPVDSSL